MENFGKKRRWFSFSLRGILFLTLLVGAYFAGRSHQVQDVDELRFRIGNFEAEKKIVESRVQRAEQEAREWSKKYFLHLDQDEFGRPPVGRWYEDGYARYRRERLSPPEAAAEARRHSRWSDE